MSAATMSDRDIFQKLLSNEFIPNFNYADYTFTFETVFYHSAFTYRLCECGYENEYLDYISKTGSINEEMADKILENIVNGKCPHVDKVHRKYVRETSIPAIHIAVFVGNDQALDSYLNNYRIVVGNLFEMGPYRLALLRENIDIVSLFQNEIGKRILRNNQRTIRALNLTHVQRDKEKKQRVVFQSMSAPELCARTGNRHFLKIILKPTIEYDKVYKAFGQALNQNFKAIENDLTEYMRSVYEHGRYETLISCAEYAVVNDRPNLLCNMLQILRSSKTRQMENLARICSVMNRPACEEILKSFGVTSSSDHVCDLRTTLSFLSAALTTYFDDSYRTNLQTHLKDTFYKKTKARIKFCSRCCQNIHPSVFKVIEELGADVDSKDGETGARTDHSGVHGPSNDCQAFKIDNSDGHSTIVCNGTPCRNSSVCDSNVFFRCGARVRHTPNREDIERLLFRNPPFSLHASESVRGSVLLDLLAKRSYSLFTREDNTCSFQRENIEMLLYQNPPFSLKERAVAMAFELDKHCESVSRELNGEVIMDAEEHSLHGYTEADELALSFYGPLLLECGFPVSRKTLVSALENRLHEAERAYLLDYMSSPRSLQRRCRDVIRNHFSGRQLHQFVATLDLPKKVKDFLLLKDILLTLKK